MKSITCAFGRQSALKNAVQYRPAIDLILPRKNNSTFFTTVVNPQGTHENRKLKRELSASCQGTEPTILLFGDVFSMSPMLVHSLLIEEVARHTSDAKDLEYLKLHTRCFELVQENEPFVAFRIVRIFKAPVQISWDAKTLRNLGYEQRFIESLNPRNKVKKSVLQKLKSQLLDMVKSNKFLRKDAKYSVNQIFQQARFFNVGLLKHRLLEAAKIMTKSESYLKLAVFFLPKYMQYLIDNRRFLDKCLNDLCNSSTPDVVLYEKYPMIWSKLPWVDQVEDTIKFWLLHDLFTLGEWEPRFDTFKKVFEARTLRGETVAAIDFELQHVATVKQIVDPDIPRTYNYAFSHEYEAELEFIHSFKNALKKEKVSVELGYQLSDVKDALVLVPNLSLKRYAALVCHPIDRKNIHVYDKKEYGQYFGSRSTKCIIAFGLDLWPFKDMATYLKGICLRKLVSNITLHAFSDLSISYFTAPRYGLRPWDKLMEASWFPKIEPVPKSAHLHANEAIIENFDVFLNEKILDEAVMHKKDRLSVFDSYVFMTYSEEDRQSMVEELSQNNRFPRSKYKYFVGDRVQTPDGFLTNIKRINQEGNVATSAWRDNYEQFMIFLENPFNEMESLCFHPTELRDAFVMRFHWLRGPLSNIVLAGAWPLYAVEEIRKLCTSNLYFHPNFSELAWQRPQHPRKNCFHSILHEQETQLKRKRREEDAAEEAARQAGKKKKLKDAYDKSKAMARKQNEATSL